MAPTLAVVIVIVIVIIIIVKRAREWIYPGPPSSRPRYEVDPPESLQKLNDDVYEVYRPAERPTVELVFFHGLQRGDNLDQAHLSTWSSRGGERELWLSWLAVEFVGARILTVSYDAALRKTETQGWKDSFQTSENLMQNLVHSRDGVGQDGCPVVLVGHSLGCLVIKEVLLRANSEVGKRLPGARKFLVNVRGIFSYSCPHKGANLPKYRRKGSFVKYLALLNTKVARLNHEFEALRRNYGWVTAGVTEGCETRMGGFKGFIVPEASARHDVDGPLYTPDADHFDVCRPANKECSSFQKLRGFIVTILAENRPRQASTKNLLTFTVGVEADVKAIRHVLKSEKSRLATVGMGGIGKTTLAKVVFDTIGIEFAYTCFVHDVKGKIGKDDPQEELRRVVTENMMYNGRKVEENKFDWRDLQSERALIVLDDVDSKSEDHVMLMNRKVSELPEMIFPRLLRCAKINLGGHHTVRNVLRVKSLRCLILQVPWEMQQLPGSLCQLSKLKYLEIHNSGATSPSPFDKIEEKREIYSVSLRKAPESPGFSALTRLEILKIEDCFYLQELPESLGQLLALSQLEIKSCPELTELPESLGHLSALLQLKIKSCRQLTNLPNSLGKLSTLCQFEIHDCEQLRELPKALGQLLALSQLKITSCRQLTELPESLCELSALSRLQIGLCGQLTELPEFLGRLQTLEELYIDYLDLQKLPESVGQLRNLKQLRIASGYELKELPKSVGQQLQSLKHLTIYWLNPMADLSASLGQFCIESLEELFIGNCEMSNLGFIDQARALQYLTLSAIGPRELPIFIGQNGTGLVTRLTIMCCDQSEIAVLPISLEYLELRCCKNLRKLPDSLEKLSQLRSLEIENCENLGNWRPSSAQVAPNLQKLRFGHESIRRSGVTSGRSYCCSVLFLRKDLLKLATEGKSLLEDMSDHFDWADDNPPSLEGFEEFDKDVDESSDESSDNESSDENSNESSNECHD